MEEIQFDNLTSHDSEDGQSIIVEVMISAGSTDGLLDEFYTVMGRAHHYDSDDVAVVAEMLQTEMTDDEILGAASDYIANRVTVEAIKKLNLRPAITPGVKVQTTPLRGKPFAFSISITLQPDITLSSYEPVTVSVEPLVITEDDIDLQVNYVAEQFVTYANADHNALQDGDYAVVDIEITQCGKKIKELSGVGKRIYAKHGKVPDELLSNLLGMSVNDIRSFKFATGAVSSLESDDHYAADVKLLALQKAVIPTINDEWVKKNMPGRNTLAEMRDAIRKDLEEQKQRVDKQNLHYKVREELASRIHGQIPDEMYQDAKESMYRAVTEQIKVQGSTVEEYCEAHEIDPSQFNMNIFMQASDYLRQNLALDALARGLNIVVTEDEIRAQQRQVGGSTAKLSDEEFRQRGYWQSLEKRLLRKKAESWLMKTASII